jgi:hypothetical protein
MLAELVASGVGLCSIEMIYGIFHACHSTNLYRQEDINLSFQVVTNVSIVVTVVVVL